MRVAKPIDRHLIMQLAENRTLMVTLEEGTICGGLGDAVNDALNGLPVSVLKIGLTDTFIEHGTVDQLFEKHGLSAGRIAVRVETYVKNQQRASVQEVLR
jgi:1-deoxy-D-xylulose-5-phosphate synthase